MIPIEDERQIVHHARIAAFVAVFVAAAELAISEWVHGAYEKYPLWTVLIGITAFLALFFAVFWVIRLYERSWHTRDTERRELAFKQPITLLKCGVVDGIWIDAVYDVYTKECVEGSVIKIESSGAGFYVEGWGYDREDLQHADDLSKVPSCSHFSGTGRQWDSDCLIYAYEGMKGLKQRDKGAVVYEFTRPGGSQLMMSGVFFGFGLQTAFYLRGKRIGEKTKYLSPDLQREKLRLREFLCEQPQSLA